MSAPSRTSTGSVASRWSSAAPGRLVGIITNRDVRFATDPGTRVYELMTRDNLVTATADITPEQARQLLHRHRIEKLVVTDDTGRCVGLITVKDMDKAQAHPNSVKDALGRLRCAAATGVGRGWLPPGRGADRRARSMWSWSIPRMAIPAACWRRSSDQADVEHGADRRRQRGDARRRAGADPRRRRCGEDRHRPGQHMHHPDRRRRRRAAVDRGAGMLRRGTGAWRPGHCRWRHPHLGRHRQGDRRRRRLRDDGQPLRRHRRGAGRGFLYQGRSYKSYRGMGCWAPWRGVRPTATSSRRCRTR